MKLKSVFAVLAALVCGVATAQNRPPPKDPSEFMSAECLRLAETVRTSPGNKAAQSSFDERCSTELGLARQKAKEENSKNTSVHAQRRAQQREELETTESIQKQQRQCSEMKSALANRKARATGTESDRRDIELFEQRLAQRCPSKG